MEIICLTSEELAIDIFDSEDAQSDENSVKHSLP
jgi:hypothetical protein